MRSEENKSGKGAGSETIDSETQRRKSVGSSSLFSFAKISLSSLISFDPACYLFDLLNLLTTTTTSSKKKKKAARCCRPEARRGPRRRRCLRVLPGRPGFRRRPRPRGQGLFQHLRDVPLRGAEHPRGRQDARERSPGAVPVGRLLRGVDREAGRF